MPPTAAWSAAPRYRVTLADSAENVEGKPLEEPVAFEFSTVGYLEVSQVVPAPGSDELDPDTTVTVVFNRPVVPLTAISRPGRTAPAADLCAAGARRRASGSTPPSTSSGPRSGFLPATHYKARVAAGLTDTSGGVLEEDYTWEFTTIRPAVRECRRPNRFQYVGPTDVISVTFNQPMDHASVQADFSPGAGRPAGGRHLPLERRRDAHRRRDDGLCARRAPAPRRRRRGHAGRRRPGQGRATWASSKAETWRFSTVKQPGIVRTTPADGADDVDPGGSLRITFASPMQREGFLDHLTIRPEVTKVYTYWSEYDTEVRIYLQRDPATDYRVTLDADTPDKYGAALGQAARIALYHRRPGPLRRAEHRRAAGLVQRLHRHRGLCRLSQRLPPGREPLPPQPADLHAV